MEHPLIVSPPVQQRSRDALQRMLVAGAAVLEQDGWEAFTIAEVARRADVSAAAIYARFADKHALFLTIHQREMDRMIVAHAAALDAAPAPADPQEAIAIAVDALLALGRDNADLLRVFNLRGAVDERVRAQGQGGVAALATQFHAAALRAQGADRKRVGICWRLTISTLTGWLTYTGVTRDPGDFDRFAADVRDVCRTYVA